MMKILFFTGVPVDDAATLYRAGFVAKKLVRRGFKIIFTSVSANFKGKETKKVSGLPVLFIGQAHYFAEKPFAKRKRLGLVKVLVENLKTCFRFGKILREQKPDKVLVVTAMPVSLLVGLISKILGFRTFIDIEDLVVGQMEAAGYAKWLVLLYSLGEKLLIRIFDKVTVCSHYLHDRYPGSILLPNMVEIGLWRKQKNRKTEKQRSIVFVGQMGPYHGQMEVLNALAPILKKNKNLKFIFIGGGERLENVKCQISNVKLGKQVVFTGQIPQSEVASILATADIGILPLWDSPVHQARHPLKLLEYLAAGLVVISNNVGEVGRIIEDGENGILCPAGDIRCLAQKTEMILTKPDLVQKISKKAVVSVEAFSVKKILPKWIEFLR